MPKHRSATGALSKLYIHGTLKHGIITRRSLPSIMAGGNNVRVLLLFREETSECYSCPSRRVKHKFQISDSCARLHWRNTLSLGWLRHITDFAAASIFLMSGLS
jgi:hypothetical protein